MKWMARSNVTLFPLDEAGNKPDAVRLVIETDASRMKRELIGALANR